MKLYSKLFLAGCTCIATLAFSTSVAKAAGPTGACCLPNGTCQSAMALSCTVDLVGTYQGDGTDCGAGGCGACCLPNNECETITQLSCDTLPKIGGYCGDGTSCTDPGVCGDIIPAISNFGLAALVILVLAAGVIAIRRGRRVSAVG